MEYSIDLFVGKQTTNFSKSIDQGLPATSRGRGLDGLGFRNMHKFLEQRGSIGFDGAAMRSSLAGKLGFHFGPDWNCDGHDEPPLTALLSRASS